MIGGKTGKTRMIDIAERVGVSKGAVACVLNGTGKNTIRVSESKRTEILRAAREMNYVPNMVARSLAGKSSMKIGALIDSHAPLCNYRTLWTLEEAAAAGGYRLMIGPAHNDPQSLFDCCENFIRHGLDGVICMAHEYPGREHEVRDYFADKRNLVFLDPPGWDAPHLRIDREAGMMQAVRHLQETGRRRIGLWLRDSLDCFSYRQRLNAFRRCCDGEMLVSRDLDLPAYLDVIREQRLDAVIAANDVLAARLLRELLLQGIRVPDDIALIGHDNDNFSAFSYPSITTIDQQDEQAGRQLFELLMKQFRGEKADAPAPVLESRLIIRESSVKQNGI